MTVCVYNSGKSRAIAWEMAVRGHGAGPSQTSYVDSPHTHTTPAHPPIPTQPTNHKQTHPPTHLQNTMYETDLLSV